MTWEWVDITTEVAGDVVGVGRVHDFPPHVDGFSGEQSRVLRDGGGRDLLPQPHADLAGRPGVDA